MKLKFNEDNNLVCPKCEGIWFNTNIKTDITIYFEKDENMIIPIVYDSNRDIYDTTEIECDNCGYILNKNMIELEEQFNKEYNKNNI